MAKKYLPNGEQVTRDEFLAASEACESLAGMPAAIRAVSQCNAPSKVIVNSVLSLLNILSKQRETWMKLARWVAESPEIANSAIARHNGIVGDSAHHIAANLALECWVRIRKAVADHSYTDSLLGKHVFTFDFDVIANNWDAIRHVFVGWPTHNWQELAVYIRRERALLLPRFTVRPKSKGGRKPVYDKHIERYDELLREGKVHGPKEAVSILNKEFPTKTVKAKQLRSLISQRKTRRGST